MPPWSPCGYGVDYLRSCYETEFRFFKDGPTTLVRWFFTDKPMMPFEHSFGSRNWMSEGDQWDDIGEVQGASRKYFKGAAPGEFPTAHICGTREQWINGDLLPPDPPVPVTVQRIPICCLDSYDSRLITPQWGLERSFDAGIGIGIKEQATWGLLRTFDVNRQEVGKYPAIFGQERYFEVARKERCILDPVWKIERSLQTREEATVDDLALMQLERSMLMSVQLDSDTAPIWSHEQQWDHESKASGKYLPNWSHERSWTVTVGTRSTMNLFTCGSQVAAGTTQGTATLLASDTVLVTSTGANQGVILPAGCYRIVVKNNNVGGGNAIKIYPPAGAQFLAIGANNPISLNAQASQMFVEVSATQWQVVAVS